MNERRSRPAVPRDRPFVEATISEHGEGFIACAMRKRRPDVASAEFLAGYDECFDSIVATIITGDEKP